MSFDYTGTPPNNTMVTNGTKLEVLPFNTSVELVMQDTNILGAESHPLNLHGFNFSMGWLRFWILQTSILLAQLKGTQWEVPSCGWVAIRFLADNLAEVLRGLRTTGSRYRLN
ncbi:Laccase-17 [Glycine soja]|uniref:Laccase-17 n=1 Tax=Glycine soja TaxID=3848 RepID=A0A0B2RZ33_GLYSO|nr:Laccase-17 [Glycine soja]